MGYGRVCKQYKMSNIETAGKLDLIIICYEKAILCLKQAKNHIKENEIEKKALKIQKVLDIINTLQGCLNIEEGGQVAKNLDAIYTYLNKRLLLGDIQKDMTAFDECANILTELKSAWKEISSAQGKDRTAGMDRPDHLMKDNAQIAA